MERLQDRLRELETMDWDEATSNALLEAADEIDRLEALVMHEAHSQAELMATEGIIREFLGQFSEIATEDTVKRAKAFLKAL